MSALVAAAVAPHLGVRASEVDLHIGDYRPASQGSPLPAGGGPGPQARPRRRGVALSTDTLTEETEVVRHARYATAPRAAAGAERARAPSAAMSEPPPSSVRRGGAPAADVMSAASAESGAVPAALAQSGMTSAASSQWRPSGEGGKVWGASLVAETPQVQGPRGHGQGAASSGDGGDGTSLRRPSAQEATTNAETGAVAKRWSASAAATRSEDAEAEGGAGAAPSQAPAARQRTDARRSSDGDLAPAPDGAAPDGAAAPGSAEEEDLSSSASACSQSASVIISSPGGSASRSASATGCSGGASCTTGSEVSGQGASRPEASGVDAWPPMDAPGSGPPPAAEAEAHKAPVRPPPPAEASAGPPPPTAEASGAGPPAAAVEPAAASGPRVLPSGAPQFSVLEFPLDEPELLVGLKWRFGATHGAWLKRVECELPEEVAEGMRVGYQLLAINDIEVLSRSSDEIRAVFREQSQIGDAMRLKFLRHA